MRTVNAHDKLALREEPMLLMEFHGSPAGVKEQAETVQEIATEHGGKAFEWATTPEERTRLWTARHNAYFAGAAVAPGLPHDDDRHLRADLAPGRVPARLGGRSRRERACRYFLVGHVGDGNFHFGYLLDPNDARGARDGRAAEPAAGARARCALDGTCTGEHGVGLHKMGFLVDRSRRRRGRHDAHDQARARPEEHHEPGQDLRRRLTALRAAAQAKSETAPW